MTSRASWSAVHSVIMHSCITQCSHLNLSSSSKQRSRSSNRWIPWRTLSSASHQGGSTVSSSRPTSCQMSSSTSSWKIPSREIGMGGMALAGALRRCINTCSWSHKELYVETILRIVGSRHLMEASVWLCTFSSITQCKSLIWMKNN